MRLGVATGIPWLPGKSGERCFLDALAEVEVAEALGFEATLDPLVRVARTPSRRFPTPVPLEAPGALRAGPVGQHGSHEHHRGSHTRGRGLPQGGQDP